MTSLRSVRPKQKTQTDRDIKDAYVVKDDNLYAYSNNIPLWMFGLNY